MNAGMRKKLYINRQKKAVLSAIIICVVLAVIPAGALAAIVFSTPPNVMGERVGIVRSAATVDVDKDGDLDVVAGVSQSASSMPADIVLWRNDGSPFLGGWDQYIIGTVQDQIGDNSIAVADIDKDGDMDVVAGASSAEDNEIIILENDGTPMNGVWIQHDVGSSMTIQNTSVVLTDLDNDSWTDIVSMATAYSGTPMTVMIWRNDGTPLNGVWSGQTIYTSYALGPGMDADDMDNDGDDDIVIGHSEYFVSALQNDGTPFSGPWPAQYVGWACAGMVGDIEAVDLDGDSYLDLATSCGYMPSFPQRVWKNDGTPFNSPWMPNTAIITSASTLCMADCDMDGDSDLVYGTHLGYVICAENDGTPFSGMWAMNTLGNASSRTSGLAAGDLDSDGDDDLVSLNNSNLALLGSPYAWQNLAVTMTEVTVDIKPGSYPNAVNTGANGVIPLAILTTADFDASTVDPFSVKMEGSGVRVKGKSGNAGSLEDVDGDGDLDLVVQIIDGSALAGKDMARITATTFGGKLLFGYDSVAIVN